MADTIIIPKADTAANSDEFYVYEGKPITVYAYPVASLTAAEYINLQRKDPEGTWQDVYDSVFGGQVRLDTTVTGITIQAPGTYRMEKEDPTNAIGVAIAENAD